MKIPVQAVSELIVKLLRNLREDEGQDLIEYALVVALIAFAAIAGMNSVASNINTAFSNVGAQVASTT